MSAAAQNQIQSPSSSEGRAAQSETPIDRKLRKDLHTLALFIDVYCQGRHAGAARGPVVLRTIDVASVYGKPLNLCPDCARLAAHAFSKRLHCPLDPKPACKRCPRHCYAPRYRAAIREVMRYSGRRLIFSGRLHYLWRLLV